MIRLEDIGKLEALKIFYEFVDHSSCLRQNLVKWLNWSSLACWPKWMKRVVFANRFWKWVSGVLQSPCQLFGGPWRIYLLPYSYRCDWWLLVRYTHSWDCSWGQILYSTINNGNNEVIKVMNLLWTLQGLLPLFRYSFTLFIWGDNMNKLEYVWLATWSRRHKMSDSSCRGRERPSSTQKLWNVSLRLQWLE